LLAKGTETSLKYTKIENKFKDRYENIKTTLYNTAKNVSKKVVGA
jgi:hypothetical protein